MQIHAKPLNFNGRQIKGHHRIKKQLLKFFDAIGWLIDRVKVLHPTRHKIGHDFADVLPSQSLGLVLKN